MLVGVLSMEVLRLKFWLEKGWCTFSPNAAAANGSKLISSREFMYHWLVKPGSSIPCASVIFAFQYLTNPELLTKSFQIPISDN
jgi:hypothetical protein